MIKRTICTLILGLMTAVGCGEQDKKSAEKYPATSSQQLKSTHTIKSMLDYYDIRDKALVVKHTFGSKKLGNSYDDLIKMGYEIGFKVPFCDIPRIPAGLDVTCHPNSLSTIEVDAEKNKFYILLSFNRGGWNGKNTYVSQTIDFNSDNPYEWQLTWESAEIDMGDESKIPKRKSGNGFNGFCKEGKGIANFYKQQYERHGFYCVGWNKKESDANTQRFAAAVLFLEGIDKVVCGR